MIIKIFNKEIEIDETNKGIDFFLKEMCKPINETSVVFNYWQMMLYENDKATIDDAVYSDEYQIKYAEPIRKVLDNGNEDDCSTMAVHTGMILRADLREYAQKIKTPTLVVGAKTDHVFSYRDVSETAHLIGCKSFFYEESGHAVFDEEPGFKQKVLEHYAASEKD